MKKTAYCKINLTLEILGTKRADGFHDLKTIMHKIPLGDIIELEVCQGKGDVTLDCDSDVCKKEDNLAYRAATAYLDVYEKNTGKCANVDIKLQKVSPTGAGLGGGSADAACVLDMLYGELGGVSEDEVLDLAKRLGSDVPFCLDRYICAYCTGRGEICENIAHLPPDIYMIIAKPVQSINTKGIYGEYDKAYGDDYTKRASDDMRCALEKGDLSEISKHATNDFEKVCIPRLSEIDDIKNVIKSEGASACQMSGSGSAVFGIFEDEGKARACYDILCGRGLCEVFLFTPIDFEKMYKGE